MRKKFLFFTLCFLVCGGFSAFSSEPVASPANPEIRQVLNDIESKMRQIESLQTRFIQKKQLSLFQHEIQIKGSIAMQKPDRFAWHTESPLRYSIIADRDKISQWDEDTDHVETLSFSSSPVVRMVIEQMQTWFYGAYGELIDQYEITLISKEPVALKFVPAEKSPALGMIRSVTMTFRQDLSYISSILIEEKNGDSSSMDFTETVLNSKIDPEVWKAKRGN